MDDAPLLSIVVLVALSCMFLPIGDFDLPVLLFLGFMVAAPGTKPTLFLRP